MTKYGRYGRWIEIEDDSYVGGGGWMCSACSWVYAYGAYFEMDTFSYCPHCGARMDGDSND